MLWFYGLFQFKKIIKPPFWRIFAFSLLGFLVFFIMSQIFLDKVLSIGDNSFKIKNILFSIYGVWSILSYSQILIHIDSILLKKNKRILVLLLHFFSILLGIGLYVIYSFDKRIFSLSFVSLFLITRNSWFILNQLIEFAINKDWPAFNILGVSPNLILAIHFRMTFRTKLFNYLSELFWKKKIKNLYWILLLSATFLEFFWFFTNNPISISYIFSDAFNYSTYLLLSLFLSIFHEWGHLIAAKMYGGFGSYISKLNSLINVETVQIPLLLFTPKERIKIAIMGTLWCNLVILFPTVLSIISVRSGNLFNEKFELFLFTMVYYAVISTTFFFLSIWSGGDINNIIRDVYLIISGKQQIPKTIFNSESEINYSDENIDFKLIETQTYSFPKHVLLKHVNENSYYFLDEKKQTAFFINDVAYEITKILLELNYWSLADILTQLKQSFDLEENEMGEVKADLSEFLTYLGNRDYLIQNEKSI